MRLWILDLIVRDGGLIEAEGNRTLLTRVVPRPFPWHRGWRPALPFGWSAERDMGRDAYVVGPSWFIVPRRWFREARWRFYETAIRIDLAREPYEGCYWNELVWFPDMPRFA